MLAHICCRAVTKSRVRIGMLEEDSPRKKHGGPGGPTNPTGGTMFDRLTAELLDLTAESKGARLANYALNIDCCCCSCCWTAAS